MQFFFFFFCHGVTKRSLYGVYFPHATYYWATPLDWLRRFAGYWQDLEHTVVIDPEQRKHVEWVTCPAGIQALQELG